MVAVVVPWDKVGQGLSDAWTWISKQARAVSNKVADSFARSVPRTYRSPQEVHHLVAQWKTNQKALQAQRILDNVDIDFNDPANLVSIKASLHRRLHSNSYYGYANSMLISAYNKGGTYYQRRTNVYAALARLRAFVISLDAASPW